MDQIFIKDLNCRGIIGINEQERERPMDIFINVVIFADTTLAARTDLVMDTVDYSKVAQKIMQHTEKVGRQTVEALAGDIAALVLEDPRVEMVRVRVDKPGAVRFTASVGVEIERRRLA